MKRNVLMLKFYKGLCFSSTVLGLLYLMVVFMKHLFITVLFINYRNTSISYKSANTLKVYTNVQKMIKNDY